MNMITDYSTPQATQVAMAGQPAEYAVDYMLKLLNVVADHNPIMFIYKIYSKQLLCVPLKLRKNFDYFRNHLVLEFPKWSKTFLNLKGIQRNCHG